MQSTQAADYQRTRLLSASEVCVLLGVHLHTVYRMADRGELTRIHVGPKLVRYAETDLAKFMPPLNDERPAPPPDARQEGCITSRAES
jgi:excisionase family DNA binding protein